MAGTNSPSTVTLKVGGLMWASSDAVIDATLGRRPGVVAVHANAHAGTATVSFDPARTSVADLAGWIRDCGFHCAGASVPDHVCHPMAEPEHPGHPDMDHTGHAGPVGVDHPRPEVSEPTGHAGMDRTGHGEPQGVEHGSHSH